MRSRREQLATEGRVSMDMRCLVLIVSSIVSFGPACGGKQQTQGGGASNDEHTGVVEDTRTPFEKRLDAACDALGPKLTQCAVDDSKAELAAGRITQKQYAELTRPEVRAGLTKDWDTRCKRPATSSRQLRVLEVCFTEETECGPLLDCLENLNAPANQ
jgi:hypothetical protein